MGPAALISSISEDWPLTMNSLYLPDKTWELRGLSHNFYSRPICEATPFQKPGRYLSRSILRYFLLSSVSPIPWMIIVTISAVELEKRKRILFIAQEFVFVVFNNFLVYDSFKEIDNDTKGVDGLILWRWRGPTCILGHGKHTRHVHGFGKHFL